MGNDLRGTEFEYGPPKWLESVLKSAVLSADFQERCRNAGLAAYAITQMRRTRVHDSFVPMSFGRYVKGLAELAKVSLAPVLETLGISSFSEFTEHRVALLAKLANQLGMSEAEARNLLRLGVAESVGLDGAIILVAHRGGSSMLESCEQVLAQYEVEYDSTAKRQLAAVLSAITQEYRCED